MYNHSQPCCYNAKGSHLQRRYSIPGYRDYNDDVAPWCKPLSPKSYQVKMEEGKKTKVKSQLMEWVRRSGKDQVNVKCYIIKSVAAESKAQI